MDAQADVLRVRAELEREYGLGGLAGVGPDLTRAQQAAALGIHQQLGHAFVAGEAERTPDKAQGSCPRRRFPGPWPWPRSLRGPSRRPRGRCRRPSGSSVRRTDGPGPAMTSAATLASWVALWASTGSPTTSPTAKM